MRSRWFCDIQSAAAYVDSLPNCNAYVGIGLSPSDFGESHRCKSEDVAGLIGFGVDIDLKSDAHPKGNRPASIEQALSLLPHDFYPSLIVETGNGIQAWWLFKEPVIFDDAAQRANAADIAVRWQTLFDYAAKQHGWNFEKLGDLARVLRIPGTRNWKDLANPKNVVIRESTDRRYNLSDLAGYLDALQIPSDEDQTRVVNKLGEGFSDTPIVINIAAEIPADLLARWLAQDPRFNTT